VTLSCAALRPSFADFPGRARDFAGLDRGDRRVRLQPDVRHRQEAPVERELQVPVLGDDRIVDRHQLGPVRKRPFNLDFVDELRHSLHHVGAPEQLAADVHQLGDRAAVADELQNLRRDERDRLGMIQPHAPRQALLRQHAGLVQRELVEFLRG